MTLRRATPIVERIVFATRRTNPQVWRDDLARILEWISEANPDLEIAADDYVLDSLDDLDDIDSDCISRFTITTHGEPDITFTLSPEFDAVVATNPGLAASGALANIEKLMKKRRRLKVSPVVLAILVACFVLAVLTFILPSDADGDVGVPGFVLAIVGLFLVTFTERGRSHSEVHARARAQAPTFFERNRDAIWINIAVLIVGAVLGYLVGKIR